MWSFASARKARKLSEGSAAISRVPCLSAMFALWLREEKCTSIGWR